jgi:hypothetical protein
MKHVVIRRQGSRVSFNHEFVHFAAHYGFSPIACLPYSPWLKGKAERPIDYIRERFRCRYQFESLQAANRDLRKWLDTVANNRKPTVHIRLNRRRDMIVCPRGEFLAIPPGPRWWTKTPAQEVSTELGGTLLFSDNWYSFTSVMMLFQVDYCCATLGAQPQQRSDFCTLGVKMRLKQTIAPPS